MSRLLFHYNDGGRTAAGYRGKARDCAARAIAIATGRPTKTSTGHWPSRRQPKTTRGFGTTRARD